MNAEIIAVGSELLLGQIVNTNARFLSEQLAKTGVNVYYHTVVGDNPRRLQAALQIAEERANIIILTGGLGPTKDDLTKETVATQIGRTLVVDDDAVASMEDYFKKTNRPMTNNNRKQALVITGSHVLKNDYGMAPGMLVKTEKHLYMLLPGPPSELEPMFLTYGYGALIAEIGLKEQIVSRVLRFFGIGEATLETKIEDIIEHQSNPTVAPLAGDGEVTIRITAKDETLLKANKRLDAVEKEILHQVGEYFYGYDQTSLMKELMKCLQERGLTIASAESLTGGMFQQQLTAIPGAGAVFKGGLVTYTNEAKNTLLHVKKETIEQHGVVSEACAREMAENVRQMLQADIGISFTGVAGPDTLEGVPVGTVYIGFSFNDRDPIVHCVKLGSRRDTNRKRSVAYGCYYLLKIFSSSH